jgi:hypothetical protein
MRRWSANRSKAVRWNLPSHICVFAGSTVRAEVRVRLRMVLGGSVELRIDDADAQALTAGIAAWEPAHMTAQRAIGTSYCRFLVTISILVGPGLAAIPARRNIRMTLVERDSDAELGSAELRVKVLPGFTRVRNVRDGAVQLRNQTAITWTRHKEWVVDPSHPTRHVAMEEQRVAPDEIATFLVPRELWQIPLRLVSDRVAVYSPSFVAADVLSR